MSLDLSFDHFYTYAELTRFLEDAATEYPGLASLCSVGKSYEGRDIWCLVLTNRATGTDKEKPAVYFDGNIHAGEVTGSHVCLYTIKALLDGYGRDKEVTYLLDTRTFYMLPRVNPDGAEMYLTTPFMLRSSVRPYPEPEEKEGLRAEDINGDGLILQMRIPDPNGPWKVSDRDPRLMVLRRPDDYTGQFYRVYPEGRVYGNREGTPKVAPSRFGLDINRNFPANWRIEQSGAGPYPLSEPETRALAEFILSHPNISTFQAYHTSGGVIYRPFCTKPDSDMIPADLAIFRAIGQRGQEITGYKPLPASHGGLGASRAGIFIDWVYEHRGIIGFTTELWDMAGRAGVNKDKEWRDKTPQDIEEDELKLLKWQDEHLQGHGFVNWTGFDHPDFGHVEIGGWIQKTVRQNAPPGPLLADECERSHRFAISLALTTPRLVWSDVAATPVAPGVYRVVATLQNEGYLATYVTQQALRVNAVKPIKVTVSGGEVVSGRAEQEIGHLEGRASVTAGPWGVRQSGDQERRLVWVVKAPAGTVLGLTAASERGGTARATVTLG